MSTQRILSIVLAFGLMSLASAEPRQANAEAQENTEAPHVVFVTGDDEYRSEITMPMIAAILEKRHRLRTTILYAQDFDGNKRPQFSRNLPGLEALADADLAVIFLRFRVWPDEQVAMLLDYVNSGKPFIGLRTSTHAFDYPEEHKYYWLNDGFGINLFGQKWIDHADGSTRAMKTLGDHPITRGIADEFWGRSWLYVSAPIHGDAHTLMHGYAVDTKTEFDKNGAPHLTPIAKPEPIAWTRTYRGGAGKDARVFYTSLGHPQDFEKTSMRRLLINGIFWALGIEEQIPEEGLDAEVVGEYVAPPIIGGSESPRG